jgi:hypothetical protein
MWAGLVRRVGWESLGLGEMGLAPEPEAVVPGSNSK